MIIFEYKPTTEGYTPIKLEIALSDDSTADDHFEAWKHFMNAMTFHMDGFEMVREKDTEDCDCDSATNPSFF